MVEIESIDNDDYETPVVNYALCLACAAVFAVELALPPEKLNHFFDLFGFNAHAAIGGAAGAGKAWALLKLLFDPLRAEWWRGFSALFVHADVFHILGNLAFLLPFGACVEHAMGRSRYFAFFLLTGFLANFIQAFAANADMPCIGASGAICGVMGAYCVFYPRAAINLNFYWWEDAEPFAFRVSAWLYLLLFFATQVGLGFMSAGEDYFAVAVWAHAGGFALGCALAWPFKDPEMMFMTEAHRLLGLPPPPGVSAAPVEFDVTARKINPLAPRPALRRPSLKVMRKKGEEEMRRRREKGSDWYK